MLEDQILANMAAIPSPLPHIAEDEVFSPEQWTTFLSICEVFVPAMSTSTVRNSDYAKACNTITDILPEGAEQGLAEKYLAETVAGSLDFKEGVRRRFIASLPQSQIKGLIFLLNALNTRIGSLVATGSTVAIHVTNLSARSRIVLSWENSSIGPLRALYKACEALTKMTWLTQSNTLNRVIDYPEIPKHIERHPSYEFEFIDFSSSQVEGLIEVEADIVIVGSGCGAGVVADHLARNLSGLERKPRVLLLEKGYHFPSTHFPMDPGSAGTLMQEGGGGILSDDGSIAVVAGSVFGGGGMINWSASLQPQHFVREDWARQTKSPMFLSQDFQACLDEVCGRMGVCRANDHEGLSKIEHNYGNKALLEAARRLGLAAEVVPQNTAGKRHYCGRCHYGCAAATKQGPANLWLPSAAKNGVEFVEGCFIDKIVWDEVGSASQDKRATGLRAKWTSRDGKCNRSLSIKASKIVLSSGTLHSPLILHRSGMTPETNKHIGSNLHLHPVMSTRGTYEERVDPWDGAILTAAMESFDNREGKGHGSKTEVNLGTPDFTGAILPYRPQLSLDALSEPGAAPEEVALRTALDYKVRMAQHGYTFTYITIQRDHADETNSKRCYVYSSLEDPEKVKINYTPSKKDRESILQGVIAAAKMHYVMGAKTIDVLTPSIEVFERPSTQAGRAEDNAAFDEWITNIQSKGLSLLDTIKSRYGSAHQMSTCRMSTSPDDGVVDTSGKVWGTRNVYVADASILPSASGVNPMVSTMGLSLHVAKAIATEFKKGWE